MTPHCPSNAPFPPDAQCWTATHPVVGIYRRSNKRPPRNKTVPKLVLAANFGQTHKLKPIRDTPLSHANVYNHKGAGLAYSVFRSMEFAGGKLRRRKRAADRTTSVHETTAACNRACRPRHASTTDRQKRGEQRQQSSNPGSARARPHPAQRWRHGAATCPHPPVNGDSRSFGART